MLPTRVEPGTSFTRVRVSTTVPNSISGKWKECLRIWMLLYRNAVRSIDGLCELYLLTVCVVQCDLLMVCHRPWEQRARTFEYAFLVYGTSPFFLRPPFLLSSLLCAPYLLSAFICLDYFCSAIKNVVCVCEEDKYHRPWEQRAREIEYAFLVSGTWRIFYARLPSCPPCYGTVVQIPLFHQVQVTFFFF